MATLGKYMVCCDLTDSYGTSQTAVPLRGERPFLTRSDAEDFLRRLTHRPGTNYRVTVITRDPAHRNRTVYTDV